eukprot:9386612-Pyramimonas_sp.AAC.1
MVRDALTDPLLCSSRGGVSHNNSKCLSLGELGVLLGRLLPRMADDDLRLVLASVQQYHSNRDMFVGFGDLLQALHLLKVKKSETLRPTIGRVKPYNPKFLSRTKTSNRTKP